MKGIFVIGLLFVVTLLHAQPPGIDDSIMSIKRKWSRGETHIHAVDSSLKPSQFTLILKKIEAVAALFKQAYPEPTGTDAKWYSQIRGQAWYKGGPAPYGFNSLFDYFYYNSPYKKIINVGETGTWAYAYFNDFNWLLKDAAVYVTINGVKKKTWELSPEAGTWKGHTVFEPPSFAPNCRLVLVTKNDHWPLKPVSQLEYLTALKEKELSEKTRMLKEQDEGIEKGKKQIEKLRSATGYSADLKAKMISTAEESLARMTEAKAKNILVLDEMVAKRVKIIDDYLQSTNTETLSQQAIVNAYKEFQVLKKFEDPSRKEARKLVHVDQSYFNKQLPAYEPQFCALFWRWNNNAPGLFFKKQFEENFPVEALKGMLR